jgi:N utilization substance protein A
MGSRVRNVMSELHGEKIDIVDYSEDPAGFVANALSPARVSKVHVVDLAAREAQVIVPDYQLSLAIGKEGQNARLAARLTGWRIDIRSDAEPRAAEPRAAASQASEPRAAAPQPAGDHGPAGTGDRDLGRSGDRDLGRSGHRDLGGAGDPEEASSALAAPGVSDTPADS